jgi:hypothetical protein
MKVRRPSFSLLGSLLALSACSAVVGDGSYSTIRSTSYDGSYLGPCSGAEYYAISDCSSCLGATAAAVCDGTSYSQCSCDTLGSNWVYKGDGNVVGTEGDGGTDASDAGSDAAASSCVPDSTVQGCAGGTIGYSCTGGDTPQQSDSSLTCGSGTTDPNGVSTDYCCSTACVPSSVDVATFDAGSAAWSCIQATCASSLAACSSDCACNDAVLSAIACEESMGLAASPTCFSAAFANISSDTAVADLSTCLLTEESTCADASN